MAHVVTAALVITKNEDGSDLYLYAGALVPDRVKGDELKRLVDEGYVVDPKKEAVQGEAVAPERPAESGPGSAKDKWQEYAAFHEVDVDAEASREQIVAAVVAAGH